RSEEPGKDTTMALQAATASKALDTKAVSAPDPSRSAPAAARARADETRAALLAAPILPTLLRLALPTMAVLVAQTAVNVAEAWYVGFVGTDALAGAALVFPMFMLMAM